MIMMGFISITEARRVLFVISDTHVPRGVLHVSSATVKRITLDYGGFVSVQNARIKTYLTNRERKKKKKRDFRNVRDFLIRKNFLA